MTGKSTLFVLAVAAAPVAGITLEQAQDEFEQFKVHYRRAYATLAEETERFQNFHESLERIEKHNAVPSHSWQRGLNQFSDMNDLEFKQAVLMAPQDCSATGPPKSRAAAPKAQDLPAHVDWRAKGVVSEVKNQGHCGSCWTFATVGCLEAHLAIKYDSWRAPRVSEQQLVDCAQAFDNAGCNGGLPSHAFEYIRYAGGLDTEFHYPYHGTDGNCTFEGPPDDMSSPFMPTSAGIGVTVPGGSVNLTVGDEEELRNAVATRGPVTIAYQVASDFRDYKSGVYTSTVCENGPQDVNHAVLVVGYGNDPVSGLDYWLVKNSWDYTFGVEGFFKIEANKNMCGLADCMSYPDLYGINAGALEGTVAV